MIDIVKMKNYLRCNIGKKICVIYYGSRNRKEKYIGVIYGVYNNIFTIMLPNGVIKSISYKDILTKSVKICI